MKWTSVSPCSQALIEESTGHCDMTHDYLSNGGAEHYTTRDIISPRKLYGASLYTRECLSRAGGRTTARCLLIHADVSLSRLSIYPSIPPCELCQFVKK